MTDESGEVSDLLGRAAAGDAEALRQLFSRYRDRLKRMVHLRLSRRLSGRVDDSDVVQEAYLDVCQKLPEYVREPGMPFFLWLRHLTGRTRSWGELIQAHETDHLPVSESKSGNKRPEIQQPGPIQ